MLRPCDVSTVSPRYPLSFQILAQLSCTTQPFAFKQFHTPSKNTQGYPIPSFRHSTVQWRLSISLWSGHRSGTTQPATGPIAARRPWCNNWQRTRNLHDPGKQLRSSRCLKILSGHREPFDGVPGYTPARSGSQVVPGSTVLTLGRSRVARVTHSCRMVSALASGKDAGKPRAGKAGSVRLG